MKTLSCSLKNEKGFLVIRKYNDQFKICESGRECVHILWKYPESHAEWEE